MDPVDAAAAEMGDRDGFPGWGIMAVVEPEGELEDDLVRRFGGKVVGVKVGGAEGGDIGVNEFVLLLEVVVEQAGEILPVFV